ncbi:TPA: hypothetical protein ACKPZX_005587 [Pseudomonas aeruginosa]|nr:hypothetical protein [Pseudomonas aeruginosa]HCF1100428.1 hypothetical protein [Pseudomonas aeruginosa]
MSSTQHQLIEQCATRLRGIVEALDNIHDSTQHRSPHRWSTDLDEVHSSAESLLAMIKDQAPPSEDQLIAAGLSYPLAKEDAVQLWYAGFRSEVVTVLEAWEAIGHDIGMNPSKGELLDSLRNMAAICNAHGNDMPAQSAIDQRQVIADAITGALAFGAQASQPPAEDHWLRPFYDIGRAEGQRTQELAMLVRMLAASLKRHAPESNLVARATNYLAAKGLAGTPLRDPPAPVEQAGGDERAAFEAWATHLPMDRQPLRPDLYMPQTQWAWEAWQFRAALAQPSQSQYEASFEEWLANELEGEDGQPVPAAVCDITLARRAFNHWPKLEHPAKVGGVRFSAGVSSRLVVEAAQRLYEFESTPEKEAERIERLQAFREQLDPLNLAPHAEAFNEAPDEAIRPEQAEAERPEVVAFRYHCTNAEGEPLPGWFYSDDAGTLGLREPLMTVAQHERIVGALRAKAVQLREALEWRKENQAGQRELLRSVTAERDDALARVAELERQQPVAWMHDQPNRVDVIHRDVKDLLQRVPGSSRGIHRPLDVSEHYTIPLYAAPVAQAQHSVPEISGIGRDAEHPRAVVLYLRNEPSEEDMRAIQNFLRAISADVLTQAQHSMPKAWLDVQAERRRQVEAEGWTPEHDDEHDSGEIACAAACYALPPAHPARIEGALGRYGRDPNIWPWTRDWWKPAPNDRRRELIKAGALVLAEIERLDRAAATQGGPRDA